MPIIGISGSDLKNSGQNLAVAAAMTTSSAVVAWGVRKLVSKIFDRVSPLPLNASTNEKNKRNGRVGFTNLGLGLAAGVGAAWYVNSKISASRYALITDPSLGKMLKLGIVQTVAGFCIDYMLGHEMPGFTVFGAGAAIAGHWSRYSYIGFGAFGALIGLNHAYT